MTMRLLWFVLAGFLLGFAASTLWEWLYFRRKRMKLNAQRVRELEAQLHEQKMLRQDSRRPAGPTLGWPQPDYHSPDVFLDSEALEEEDLSSEGTALEMQMRPATDAGGRARDAIPHKAPPATAERSAEPASVHADPIRANPVRSDPISAERVRAESGRTEPAMPVRASATIEELAANLSSRIQPVEDGERLRAEDYRQHYLQRSSDHPDDLSRIKGIGEVYKIRLYQAGIYTWHQIAQSDVDTLRAATNAYPSSNVDEWLEQAQQLAQKNGRQDAVYEGAPPDDLTKIIGIGPVGARTLYRAGICTFEQLAGALPSELHDLFPIAIAGDEPNFQHWIMQAVVLANRKQAE